MEKINKRTAPLEINGKFSHPLARYRSTRWMRGDHKEGPRAGSCYTHFLFLSLVRCCSHESPADGGTQQ